MNATLRARRSSLAIISVALPLRAASKAFANSGLRALAAFNLDVLADYGGAVLTGKRLDGGALDFEAELAFPLACRADPQIGDKGRWLARRSR